MRRVEQPLDQIFVLPDRRAGLRADAGHRHPIGGQFHRLRAADQIAAAFRDAAAGVFDQRAAEQVALRLADFAELAVVVVDDHIRVGNRLDQPVQLVDFAGRQRPPVLIALGALDEHDLDRSVGFQHAPHLGQINAGGCVQRGLAVSDAVVGQRALSGAGAADADDALERVVGPARDGIERVARPQQGVQADGDGVRTRRDRMPRKAGLGVHTVGEQPVAQVAAYVVVAVAAAACKMRGGKAVTAEGFHHLGGDGCGGAVDPPEGFRGRALAVVGQPE